MTLATNTNRHDRVVITGGGTAGLSVAATLLRQSPQLDVAVIGPSEDHTTTSPVGRWSEAVPCAPRISGGRQADVMPDKATRVQEAVSRFSPDENTVDLASDKRVSYDSRAVALGQQIDWDAIESPADTIGLLQKRGVKLPPRPASA